jgi:hypothetical protein
LPAAVGLRFQICRQTSPDPGPGGEEDLLLLFSNHVDNDIYADQYIDEITVTDHALICSLHSLRHASFLPDLPATSFFIFLLF